MLQLETLAHQTVSSSCLNLASNLLEYASKSLAATANFSTLSVTASISVKYGNNPSSANGRDILKSVPLNKRDKGGEEKRKERLEKLEMKK